MSSTIMGCLLVMLLIVLLTVIGPLALLWALNVLIVGAGGTAIALTFKSWVATFVVILLTNGSSSYKSSK